MQDEQSVTELNYSIPINRVQVFPLNFFIRNKTNGKLKLVLILNSRNLYYYQYLEIQKSEEFKKEVVLCTMWLHYAEQLIHT